MPITSSPMQEKRNVNNLLLLIATASSAAVLLAVICIVVTTVVCISLIAKRKTKSFKFPPSSTQAVEKNENNSQVSIHVLVQDVEEDEEDIKPHFVEGTRKRRHLSPVTMMVGSKENLQFDHPPQVLEMLKQGSPGHGPDTTTTTKSTVSVGSKEILQFDHPSQEMLKQGSPGHGPDTTTTTKSTVSEAGNTKKIRLFTVTDDQKVPAPTSGESIHRYDNVVIDDKLSPATGGGTHRYDNVIIDDKPSPITGGGTHRYDNVIIDDKPSPITGGGTHRYDNVIIDDKPSPITGESSHGAACSATTHKYSNVIIGTADQNIHLATPTVTQAPPTASQATPTVSRLSPIRGNRVRPVVQPYSSVTIATNFGIPMERNEAYRSREDLTTDVDDDEDDATKKFNAKDDSNDYDDII